MVGTVILLLRYRIRHVMARDPSKPSGTKLTLVSKTGKAGKASKGGSTAKASRPVKGTQRSGPAAQPGGLTQKQEEFVQSVRAGMSYSDAYRQSYNAEGMTPTSIHREAHGLTVHPKIIARFNQLQQEYEAEQRMLAASRGGYVLKSLQNIADDEDAPTNARVAALVAIGKSCALFTDKIETNDTTDRSVEELEADIRRRAGL